MTASSSTSVLPAEPASALARFREAAGEAVAATVLISPADRGAIDDLRRAGFDAYLVRPVRAASLLRVVGESPQGRLRRRSRRHAARPPAGAPPAASGLDVLLAEDNEIGALLARAVLEGAGHAVTEVRDGKSAVAAATAAAGRFSLVVMDLHMPGLDGIAAARLIRAFETANRLPRRPLLALTADVLPATRAEALAAGFDAILEKPVSPQSLRRQIGELTEDRPA